MYDAGQLFQVRTKIFAGPSPVRACTYVENVAGQVSTILCKRPPGCYFLEPP